MGDSMLQPGRGLVLGPRHRRADSSRRVERGGARALQYLERDRRLAVEQRTQRIIIRAHFDPGDLAEPGELAVGTSLDDDCGKLFLGREAALDVERDLLRGGGVDRKSTRLNSSH